jgi:uncharacterized membrane protein
MRISGGSGGTVLSWWQSLRASLLAIPLAYLVAAVGAVIGLYWLGEVETPALRPEDGRLAEDLLPAIGSATLTLAGFVLTITALSIQFTATSYAPRLVQPLRRDPVLQHTLGVALATFVFSFGVLIGVGPEGDVSATLAVGVALTGAAATILLFIGLLDRVTNRLRPGRMMRGVTDDALPVIDRAYDESHDDGDDGEGEDRVPDRVVVDWSSLPGPAVAWWEGDYGLIVGMAFDRLRDVASEHEVRIELVLPVGAFVQRREALAVVRTDAGAPVDEVTDELGTAIGGCVVVDAERTADADPAFGMRLLVDAALRALSPGTQDPTTAAQVVEHLELLLVVLAGKRLGPRELRDDADRVRVVVPAPGWDALVDLAFGEIVSCADDPQTIGALERTLARLVARVPPDRRDALRRITASLARP